jgi:hypothetical protein
MRSSNVSKGSQQSGVVQLGRQAIRVGRPAHRATHVHEQVCPQIRFFFELLDEQTIRTAVHLPVHEPDVVARTIGSVFCELDGEAPVRRAVQSDEETLYHTAGNQLQVRQLREILRSRQVQPLYTLRRRDFCHPARVADAARYRIIRGAEAHTRSWCVS